MIENVNIFQLFPRFILADTDGMAMCRALEAGMNYFLGKCAEGLEIVLDPERMPEWRLDEMAWELNCLYDYGADVALKRGWIRNAYRNYRTHGTAEGIRQYLAAYFDSAIVQEYFEFGGDPGQFNIIVSGTESAELQSWIMKAAAKAKNVRSELNDVTFVGDDVELTMYRAAAVTGIHVTDWVSMAPEATLLVGDVEDMYVGPLERRTVRKLEE
jgi:P2-related tail formation protein